MKTPLARASLFVNRIDTLLDPLLEHLIARGAKEAAQSHAPHGWLQLICGAGDWSGPMVKDALLLSLHP